LPRELERKRVVTRRMARSRLTSRPQVTTRLTCQLFLPFHLIIFCSLASYFYRDVGARCFNSVFFRYTINLTVTCDCDTTSSIDLLFDRGFISKKYLCTRFVLRGRHFSIERVLKETHAHPSGSSSTLERGKEGGHSEPEFLNF
jgi:hypothetical protein